MPTIYSNIPLSLVVSKTWFSQASDIYFFAYQIDLHFANTYLTLLRDDVKLCLIVKKVEEELIEFLKGIKLKTYYQIKSKEKPLLDLKCILLKTEESHLSITTSSNLNHAGLSDNNALHELSQDEEVFNQLKRNCLSRSTFGFA